MYKTIVAKVRHYSVEVLKTALVALVITAVLKSAVVEATQIYGASMTPTLMEGDYVFVNKFKYGLHLPFKDKMAFVWSSPDRGDVVTLLPPEKSHAGKDKTYIKRVVAIAGDRVEMIDARLFINGSPVESQQSDRYDFIYTESLDGKVFSVVKSNPVSHFEPIIVPEGSVFVIGDNRDNSYDSRDWGPLPVENIKGKAVIIYFSKTVSHGLNYIKRVGGLL